MAPKIVRETAGGCREWCDGLTGEYTYTDVPDDVYKRHKNCNCTVGFYPGESKRQNVHTRKREEAPEVLERGKAIGLSFDSKADIPLVSSQDGHTRGQKRTIQNLLKLAPPEARGQV